MTPTPFRTICIVLLCVTAVSAAIAQDVPPPSRAPAAVQGKAPIIIIPGITGSELINSNTKKTVWYSRARDKDDDLRLPISPNLSQNRDDLVPGDIIRGFKVIKFLPEVEIYEQLITSLEMRGGYKEAQWDDPGANGHRDTFYVFPYDWRRDNVETARQLVRKVADLKTRLGNPDLKFNVIAHSMGGLVARYAAMYGDADIPGGTPIPTWAGAKHFNKIFLLGTPNEGSVRALSALLNGLSNVAGGINLPFFRNINRFDVFTIPSVYQLLPHQASVTVYDEELKRVRLDIYNPVTWDEYDWSIWKDKKFEDRLSTAEQNNAGPFFRAALLRAKQFHQAINANGSPDIPVSFYLVGADCKETPNAFLIRRDEKNDRWITQFDAKSFTRSTGEKVTSEMLKPIIYSIGDSVVTRRSLAAETIVANGGKHAIPVAAELFQCESHGRLVTNPEIQDKLFTLINPADARPAAEGRTLP
jgi:pimeloyl-ACP methyl ester carboxylesterase